MGASYHVWGVGADQHVGFTLMTHLHVDPDQRVVATTVDITETCNQQPHLQRLGGLKVQQLIKTKSH